MTDTSRRFCVVGDRFSAFAQASGAVTVTDFVESMAELMPGGPGSGKYMIIPGQGISDYEISYLRQELESRGFSRDDVGFEATSPKIAGRRDVHKGREDNVLIGDLERVDDTHFSAALRIHNDHEMLIDAKSRAHLYGTVAIEAGRQMFVAVLERFYLSRWPEQRYYVVINSMTTTFDTFLFPLPAAIRLEIGQTDSSDPRKLGFQVTTEIFQSGRRSCSVSATLVCLDLATFNAIEQRRATRAVDALAGPQPQVP
jgi:hypothetical protein